jgi:glycosyltransferase involved in cell wall biosynthesis/ADP-heptose:LPS heptosyltransferase
VRKRLLFSGPVLTASGYGVHARQLLRAIVDSKEFDVTVESLRWGETPFLSDPDLKWIRDLVSPGQVEGQFDIAIQVTIPNEFKRRGTISIGVTAGIEVDRVSPQWLLRCNQEVDAIVVPSEHSQRSFAVEYQGSKVERLRLEKPIFVIPEGVDTSVYRPEPALSPTLDRLEVPGKNFVFVGLGLDKPGGRDRKNVSRLIEYFCGTFKGVKEVGLILKVSIVNGSTVDFELVKRRIAEIKKATGCGDYPKVFVVHGRAGDADLAAIYNDPRVIAAISLTHGEGFGLPLLEAAACGLPVMATDWSGHVDFLTKDGRKLFVPIEYDLGQLPPECVWEGVMDAGTNWANVRESDASTKMQKMALSSVTPRKWAAELAEHIASRYSLERTGQAFMDLVRQAALELDAVQAPHKADALEALRDRVRSKGPSLIYTMPQSAGDVFLSTGVVSALRRKHPGHRVYFATQPQYFHILKDLPDDAALPFIDELVPWEPWMQSPEALERVFDVAYTPNLNVQYQWANWVRGGTGRNLLDEFAAQCDVKADAPLLPETAPPQGGDSSVWVAVHGGGQKSARRYAYWRDIVLNLRDNGIKVMQVGAADDMDVGPVDLDRRGQGDHLALVESLGACSAFVGIDSYPMHVASALGLRTVAIFGSSYSSSTGPKNHRLPILLEQRQCGVEVSNKELMEEVGRIVSIDTPSRNGCERACYKDACRVDVDNPCINNIRPEAVFMTLMGLVLPEREVRYTTRRPKLAGYTHLMRPLTHGYPYIQSIASMLGFCDEVIVVNGDPKDSDGSIEKLRNAIHPDHRDGRLKIIDREWDPEEPGMDGMQKAFGRAMVSPEMEFLWQQDADEVVHELDYVKIHDVCRRFPSDVDVVHLPVVELWGDDRHGRTDRHSWKWRLSRNNLRVTHGIAAQARQIDEKTGRIYARKGMSDGCEMIDMVTGEHLPHRGFYSKELDDLRVKNPAEYGRAMNAVFTKLPSVWHYSWADLPRKVRNFRDFWDKQWQVLYQSPAEPRFTDVVSEEDVQRKAEELRARGGEHGPAQTFPIDRDPPAIMKGWVKDE